MRVVGLTGPEPQAILARRMATPNETQPPPPEGEAPIPRVISEGSLLPRFVALLTPFFTVAAGWLAGVVAKHFPGVELDADAVAAFMSVAALAALGAAWKWLEGWQRHEERVSLGRGMPVKADRSRI